MKLKEQARQETEVGLHNTKRTLKLINYAALLCQRSENWCKEKHLSTDNCGEKKSQISLKHLSLMEKQTRIGGAPFSGRDLAEGQTDQKYTCLSSGLLLFTTVWEKPAGPRWLTCSL